MQQSKSSIQSFRQIFFIYIGCVFVFTLLFLLPFAHTNDLRFVDSLFLSTSALSVTGLSPINIGEELTRIGQTILIIEMQLGGIGIVVLISYLFLMMDKKITVSSMLLLSKDQNQTKLGSITSLAISVLIIALIVESICFLFVFGDIRPRYDDLGDAVFVTIFHSVASFTNSGFDLFGDSLISFNQNPIFLLTTAFAIFMGSAGYPTIMEYIISRKRKKSLFAKINLRFHLSLFISGTIVFFLLEANGIFKDLSWGDTVTNAIFLSATARNGGLSTIDIAGLSITTLLILMFLMFVGGASSSTGGGIRLTTFAVLLAKLVSVARSREYTVIFRKTISQESVNKAFMVFFTFITLFFGSTVILTLFQNHSFESIMFEVMSALTNTGLSAGITSELTGVSKGILVMLMIIGRIGVFSFIYTIFKAEKVKVRYLKEDLAVG